MKHKLIIFSLIISSCFNACRQGEVDAITRVENYYINTSNRLVELKSYDKYGRDSLFFKIKKDTLTYKDSYWVSPKQNEEDINKDYFLAEVLLGDSLVVSFDSLESISFKNLYSRNESFCISHNTCFSPYCFESYVVKREVGVVKYFYEFTEEMYQCTN